MYFEKEVHTCKCLLMHISLKNKFENDPFECFIVRRKKWFVITKIQLKNCRSKINNKWKRNEDFTTKSRNIYLKDQKIFSIRNQISDIFRQNSLHIFNLAYFRPFPLLLVDMDHFFSHFFFRFCCFLSCVSASMSFKWLNCLLRIQVFFLADYFKLKLVLSHTVEFQMSP